MTEHSHVMGGSTAAQRINCPGSYLLEKKMPRDDGPNEFADRGSMLHAAMELLLLADPQNMTEAKPLFKEIEGQNMGFENHVVDDNLIVSKLRPALRAWFALDKKYQFTNMFIEQKVSLEKVIDGAFGTADLVLMDKENNLHVLDWKFGDGVPVEVEGNYGAGFYAGATLYDDNPELVEFTADFSGIVILHIVHPREGFDDVLHTWETTESCASPLSASETTTLFCTYRRL